MPSAPPANGTTGPVLVTGGAGYIGSHVMKALRDAGRTAIAYDNLSHGFREATLGAPLVVGDIRDHDRLSETIQDHGIQAVVHLAGLIEVGRSTVRPDLFWDENVTGTAILLAAMREHEVRRLVFSSSAAVYGHIPGAAWSDLLVEESPKDPASPYGDTKLACERMIMAHCAAFGLSAIALRYFNAAGADSTGQIGEAHEPETHLIPLAIEAAMGRRPPLTVFGVDFPTPDGACLRDYVHVTDLADAHVAALGVDLAAGGFEPINVGCGQGHSVLQVIDAIERVLGRPVPRSVGARRAGDPPTLVADARLANRRLSWSARHSRLDDIVASAARWHSAPRYGRGSGA